MAMAKLTPDQRNLPTESVRKPSPKQRQIRALYDEETITVYQAYNSDIASAAVEHQKLCASPHFRLARMTWIKPSWCWMMYRAGYSYKDKNQERILALKMRHEHFVELLEKATLTTEPGPAAAAAAAAGGLGEAENLASAPSAKARRSSNVKVQWDPERTPRLDKLGYRSIQIGIPSSLAAVWADDWIAGVEDVTEKARALEKEVRENSDISDEDLVKKGLVPLEREYVVPSRVRNIIGMVEGET